MEPAERKKMITKEREGMGDNESRKGGGNGNQSTVAGIRVR